MPKKEKFYVTTPIYYVNDKPHLGHAYTTLAADILARYWRDKLGKDKVFFLTGTDEHGTKVAQAAAAEGKEPQVFCDEVSVMYKKAWVTLGIEYDYFVRTTDQRHLDSVNKFIEKLKAKKALYEGKYEGLYCEGCEKFMTEKELVNGQCPDHKKPPVKLSENNYFFKLNNYLDQVKELIEKNEIKILPVERKKEVLSLIEHGLEDFSVSREKVKWGIPLVFDQKQVVYVWVEALQNYISAIGYGDNNRDFKKWWPADCHLMAKDILKFHAIFWPALLLAAGEKPPKEEFIHGFFTINGEKMSKSLGNVLDPSSLGEKYGRDGARYLLMTQFPFGADGDLSEARFKEKYNAELANGFGNLVARVTKLAEGFNGKHIINTRKSLKVDKKEKDWVDDINEAIEKTKLFDALSLWQIKLKETDQVIQNVKPWELIKDKSRKEEFEVHIRILINRIYLLAKVIKPFMPETSEKITNLLVCDKITKGEALFPRIKDI